MIKIGALQIIIIIIYTQYYSDISSLSCSLFKSPFDSFLLSILLRKTGVLSTILCARRFESVSAALQIFSLFASIRLCLRGISCKLICFPDPLRRPFDCARTPRRFFRSILFVRHSAADQYRNDIRDFHPLETTGLPTVSLHVGRSSIVQLLQPPLLLP